METALIVAVVTVAALLVLTVLLMMRRLARLEERTVGSEDLQALLQPSQLEAQVQRILDSDQRILTNTNAAFGQLQQGIGAMEESGKRLEKISESIVGLETLLKPPPLRGGIGETLLDQLLAQVLADKQYELQHSFKDGKRVDAVVRVGDRLVPVDAKFPIESFRRVLDAADDDTRRRERKVFIGAVKGHVNDIAEKYIRPEEGTFDFALMYIPAENVYYEAVLRDSESELFQYSLEKQVVPVSPNSLYAYLLVIVHGLRGMRIEEKAKEILGLLGRLRVDLGRFQEDYRVLGGHLLNARTKYDEGDRRLRGVEERLLSATDAPLELPGISDEE